MADTPSRDQIIARIGGPSAEVLDRLIYVAGTARGGTTITTRLIAVHPQIITAARPSHVALAAEAAVGDANHQRGRRWMSRTTRGNDPAAYTPGN